MTTRKPLVVANWKMNKLPSETKEYIEKVQVALAGQDDVETVLAG